MAVLFQAVQVHQVFLEVEDPLVEVEPVVAGDKNHAGDISQIALGDREFMKNR